MNSSLVWRGYGTPKRRAKSNTCSYTTSTRLDIPAGWPILNIMRVLTVRQPWASLIASGRKTIEVRSRSTRYRGPVAILAGKGRDPECGSTVYPAGVIICVVDLTDCVDLDPSHNRASCLSAIRFAQCIGHYAWVLRAPRDVRHITARGQLGLIRPSPAIAALLGEA